MVNKPNRVAQSVMDWLVRNRGVSPDADNATCLRALADALDDGAINDELLDELTSDDFDGDQEIAKRQLRDGIRAKVEREADAEMKLLKQQKGGDRMSSTTNTPSFADSVICRGAPGADRGSSIRVKDSSEGYDTTKSACMDPRTRQPAMFLGKQAETVSQWERAVFGALAKHLAKKSGMNIDFSEHDRNILAESINRETWHGMIGSELHERIAPPQVKSILDDTTSGGTYINPAFFDALIQPAVLFGELTSEVTIVPVSRGSSVDGASMASPVISWGHSEGAAQTLASTSGLISNMDTTIYAATAAYTAGRDFLSDAAVNVGEALMAGLSTEFQKELDDVISSGDGSTQPTGLDLASGAAAVSSQNGTSGPLEVADAEQLMRAIGKAYRTKPHRPRFVMHDTTWFRFKAIPLSASDQRRIFGVDDYMGYTLCGFPVRINNDLAESTIVFGALDYYRLYKRAGFEMQLTSEGRTLALANESLFVARARVGGRPTLGAAFAIMSDAPVVD